MSTGEQHVPFGLALAALLLIYVDGVDATPQMDGCLHLTEVEEFHVEDEPVVLRCPKTEQYLIRKRLLRSLRETLSFQKAGVEPLHLDSRVRQQGYRLWLLPARASDSGNYSCVFRNTSDCVVGTISLKVYEAEEPHLTMTAYKNLAFQGQTGTIRCPFLSDFNRTGTLQWFKDSTLIVPSSNQTRYHQNSANTLSIQDVIMSDEGFYTCETQVFLNQDLYKVTRTIELMVAEPDVEPISPSINPREIPVTSKPHHPQIVFPRNGSIFTAPFGSSLEIPCRVFIGNQLTNVTEVTWLVDGQMMEQSFLRGRVLTDERVDKNGQVEVTLILWELHVGESGTELKCVAQNVGGRQEVTIRVLVHESLSAWLVMGVIGTSSFLTVLAFFIFHLLKPHKKTDYIIAMQSSVV